MTFKYDLAISFAGEQRALAQNFAMRLDASGYSIFFDEFQQAELWGRELAAIFKQVFAGEARYCLIILSRDYVTKAWTNFERQNAILEFIRRRGDYLLCLKIDDIDLPGFPDGVGFIRLKQSGQARVYKLLLQKLGLPNHRNRLSHLDSDDTKLAQKVIAACFRRAVYTRMHSEIDLPAMYDSVGSAIGALQGIVPAIRDQALQFACNEIIGALDNIQRTMMRSNPRVSLLLPVNVWQQIDENKQEVVRLILEVRRAANISIQLPFALGTEHFFGRDAADKPPEGDLP